MADHGGETTVIDEDLIRISCEEERAHAKKPQAAGDAEVVPTPLTLPEIMRDVTTLRLSFKNINKIDNLAGFTQLTKLCLDNNAIDQIEGIDQLVNLRWLDLSFNRIREVKGLATLTKLEDLSLYNNQISEIKSGSGLEKCKALTCLSIGNNQLANIERLLLFRQFPALRMLNLAGNPVCSDPEYRFWVLAHLKGLKYFDFSLVHGRDVEQAREQFQDELQALEEQESIDATARQREMAAAEQTAQLRAANLGAVETLFDIMFNEDPENEHLKLFPGQHDLYEGFREAYNEVAEVWKTTGLERHAARQTETAQFEAALRNMQAESTDQVLSMIRAVDKRRKKRFREFDDAAAAGVALTIAAKTLDGMDEEAATLKEELTDLEVQQGEKFKELVDEFENELIKMKAVSSDAQQTFFRAVEDLQEKYNEQLTALVQELLDKASADALDEEGIDDALKAHLGDRDLCMNWLVGSHDIHLGKLLEEEDRARDDDKKTFDGMVKRYVDEEALRRRKRGMEIKQLVEHYTREVADKLASMADEDDDED